MDERRRVSGRQEKSGLGRYGAQAHGGSGSGWMRRNDGHTTKHEDRAVSSGVLFEFKTIVGGKKQITLKLEDMIQVERQAIKEGRIPALQIEMGGRRYVVQPDEDWIELARDAGAIE